MTDFTNIKKGDWVYLAREANYFQVEKVGSTWFRAGGISFSKEYGIECGKLLHPRYAEGASPEQRNARKYRAAYDFIETALRARNKWDPDKSHDKNPEPVFNAAKALGWTGSL